MKKILKYSFTILLLVSCIVVLGILAYKVIITDDKGDTVQPSDTEIENAETKEDGPAEELNPEDANFAAADRAYFSDALFIGDSRTMGLWQSGKIEGADFFADIGMSLYNISGKSMEVGEVGTVTLDQLLDSKSYGKIYVMLGINELGYNRANTVQKYGELIEKIKSKCPQSVIYIQGNLHVGEALSSSHEIFKNSSIDDFNQKIAAFIDNKQVFYIDVNDIFDDENGNLGAQYTSDNIHISGKYYGIWADWLLTKTVTMRAAGLS